ncbi:MAG: DUF1461 domain-containing protein [Nanoarchaeota archaeon]
MSKALIISLAIVTAILSCFLAFESTLFDRSFFKSEFKNLGIYEREGDFLPDNMSETVLLFYENKIPELNLSYLTPSETSHMVDVKNIVRSAINLKRILVVLWLILMVLLAFKGGKNVLKDIGKVYRAAGIAALLIVALLGVGALFFSPFFSLFHKVFFPQGNYLFPYDSTLLLIFTFQLQFNFFKTTIIKVLLSGCVMFLIGKFIIHFSEKKVKTRPARAGRH